MFNISDKVEKWTILEIVQRYINNRMHSFYKAKCECGTIKFLYCSNLNKKKTSQCIECYLNSMAMDMIGKKFGKLTVHSFNHSDGNSRYYLCYCECGEERICNGGNLRLNKTIQCKKCKNKLSRSITHGMKGTTTWVIWMGIKARCLNPNNRAYKNYGGRGIKVCEKWYNFEGFFEDMGKRPQGLQIDRIDNDGPYSKENCRWVTPKVNSRNRRRKTEAKL